MDIHCVDTSYKRSHMILAYNENENSILCLGGFNNGDAYNDCHKIMINNNNMYKSSLFLPISTAFNEKCINTIDGEFFYVSNYGCNSLVEINYKNYNMKELCF